MGSRKKEKEHPPAAPPAGRGRRLLQSSALLLVPVLFFVLVEAGLRLLGAGYPTSFFVRVGASGAYATNQKFGWRFFPKAIARAPAPQVVAAPRPEGTYRIYVLGSSAAMGEPEPAFSFGRVLLAMLRETHPGVRFEVVNAAMTAVNSHVVLPIARDCAAMGADLFVVYMGNNEVVGPFGPGTVLKSYSPSLLAIKAGIAVRSTRTGQLVEGALQRLAPAGEPLTEWRGMEMFLRNLVAADDPRMEEVYRRFGRNLAAIRDAAASAGARVVISTVGSNLRDNPPFASLHRAGLGEADAARWEALHGEGAALEESGSFAAAAEKYREASRIDDRHAEVRFRLARCLWEEGRFEEARSEYVAARDLDALRFRADSRINAVIREEASGREAEGVHLVDGERAFERDERTPHQVPGGELFYEHVHMNFEGSYVLARAVFEKVASILPPEIAARRAAAAPPPPERCAGLLALAPWNRFRMAARMYEIMERPPFTNHFDHERRLATFRREIEAMESAASTPEAVQAAAATYRRAVERDPDDPFLRAGYAAVLRAAGDGARAAEEWRRLLASIPGTVAWLEELGHVLLYQGNAAEAAREYAEALRIWPGRAEILGNLGVALDKQGKTGEAMATYREALRLDPALPAARLNLAIALEEKGLRAEAIEQYREAVRYKPGHAAARASLAEALMAAGDPAGAIEQYQEVLKLQPDMLPALNALALILATHEEARYRDGARAVDLAEAACRRTGWRVPALLDTLAAAYAEAGRFDDARRAASRGIELARAEGRDDWARRIEGHLRIYEAGRPLRQLGGASRG